MFSPLLLILGHDRLEVNAKLLEIRDARGLLLLSASRDAVTLGAETFAISSPAGVAFHTSVQTPLIRAPPAKQLTYVKNVSDNDVFKDHLNNLSNAK